MYELAHFVYRFFVSAFQAISENTKIYALFFVHNRIPLWIIKQSAKQTAQQGITVQIFYIHNVIFHSGIRLLSGSFFHNIPVWMLFIIFLLSACFFYFIRIKNGITPKVFHLFRILYTDLYPTQKHERRRMARGRCILSGRRWFIWWEARSSKG